MKWLLSFSWKWAIKAVVAVLVHYFMTECVRPRKNVPGYFLREASQTFLLLYGWSNARHFDCIKVWLRENWTNWCIADAAVISGQCVFFFVGLSCKLETTLLLFAKLSAAFTSFTIHNHCHYHIITTAAQIN